MKTFKSFRIQNNKKNSNNKLISLFGCDKGI